MVERVQSGIPGFDKLMEGGLPKGSITLISGTPGTGKSIFCAQVLYANALKGKKCLYLNLEQNEGRLENQMQQFGWSLEKVKKNLKIAPVDSSNPELVDFVLKEIQIESYDLIALDSLDSISSTPLSTEEISNMGVERIAESVVPMILDVQTVGRLKLKKIFAAIAKSHATALLTSEKVENSPGISRDTISEFLGDGIVILHHLTTGGSASRTLIVEKMRQTKIDDTIHPFEIGKNGFVVKEQKELYE